MLVIKRFSERKKVFREIKKTGKIRAKRFLTPRDITLEGFNLQNKVVDFVSNGVWSWPQSWLPKAPDLEQIMVPTLDSSRPDLPQWRDLNGKMSNFVFSCAWEALKPHGVEVPWYRVVWYSHYTPQHAFHLWLVMRQSLKTQNRLRQWDVGMKSCKAACWYGFGLATYA
nr:reverse transcriptase domain, reverse transcriptase zinc-binding domain protein [Tanacetum cinerariifolium]